MSLAEREPDDGGRAGLLKSALKTSELADSGADPKANKKPDESTSQQTDAFESRIERAKRLADVTLYCSMRFAPASFLLCAIVLALTATVLAIVGNFDDAERALGLLLNTIVDAFSK